MLSADDIKKAIKMEISRRIRNDDLEIPMLPHVAGQVMALAAKPNVDIKDLTLLVEHDQYISAKIINVANSPVYRGFNEVSSLQRAIVTIGLRNVSDIIFSISMGSKIFRNKDFAERMNQLWQHSVGCAFICQEIAKRYKIDADNAFLYGLLHDIGKPLIIDTVTKLVKRDPDKFRLDLIDEYLLDGILEEFHCQVGGLIGRKWRFPDTLTSAIVFHHEPLGGDSPKKDALLVGVANLFSHQLGLGTPVADMDLAAHPIIKAFGFRPDDVAKLEKELAGPAVLFIGSFL